jgi:hypothetical protein
LVAAIARPVSGVGRAVDSGPVAAGAALQAAARAIWCLWSFSRLWVAVISRHSERAADLPSSLKLIDAPVVLGLCEHRLDYHLSSSIAMPEVS